MAKKFLLLMIFVSHVGVCFSMQKFPIFDAIKSGDAKAVADCIINKCDVNQLNQQGWAPLHAAVASGKIKILDILFNNKANIDVRNSEGWTPLHLATFCGKVNIVEYLINKGAKSTLKTNDDKTILYTAVDNNKKDCVKIIALLEKLNLLQPIINDKTEVSFANIPNTLGMNISVIQGADDPLHQAIIHGHTKSAIKLIGCGANLEDFNAQKYTPLHLAILKKHIDVLKMLIKYNADVNMPAINKITPLHMAVMEDCKEAVNLLLDAGANKKLRDDRNNSLPIDLAKSKGIKKILEK